MFDGLLISCSWFCLVSLGSGISCNALSFHSVSGITGFLTVTRLSLGSLMVLLVCFPCVLVVSLVSCW